MIKSEVQPVNTNNKYKRYEQEVQCLRNITYDDKNWKSFIIFIEYFQEGSNADLSYQFFETEEQGRAEFKKQLEEFKAEYLVAGLHNRQGEVEGFMA